MERKLKYGTLLRATRLCFVYVAKWDGFMRTSDYGKNFLIELRPNDPACLDKGRPRIFHRIIDDPEGAIRLSPVLSAIHTITEPVDFILDDAWLEVRSKKKAKK